MGQFNCYSCCSVWLFFFFFGYHIYRFCLSFPLLVIICWLFLAIHSMLLLIAVESSCNNSCNGPFISIKWKVWPQMFFFFHIMNFTWLLNYNSFGKLNLFVFICEYQVNKKKFLKFICCLLFVGAISYLNQKKLCIHLIQNSTNCRMLSWIHSTICIVCSVENAKTDCRNIDTPSSAFEPTYAIGKEVKKTTKSVTNVFWPNIIKCLYIIIILWKC